MALHRGVNYYANIEEKRIEYLGTAYEVKLHAHSEDGKELRYTYLTPSSNMANEIAQLWMCNPTLVFNLAHPQEVA